MIDIMTRVKRVKEMCEIQLEMEKSFFDNEKYWGLSSRFDELVALNEREDGVSGG